MMLVMRARIVRSETITSYCMVLESSVETGIMGFDSIELTNMNFQGTVIELSRR